MRCSCSDERCRPDRSSAVICGGCDDCLQESKVPDGCRARQLLSLNVRRLRHAANLSQQELSARASIDRSHLARLEAHGINISLNIMAKIARALDVDLRRLLCPREEWDRADDV